MELFSVVGMEDDFLELFVGEPEADVPPDQSGEGGVEALVEREEPFVPGRLHGAGEGSCVAAFGAVHEPVEINIVRTLWLSCSAWSGFIAN